MGAFLQAAFIAGAFVASPELRAYAANSVGSADIINNSILSADIKDREVKTVDLANNAVTAAKIKDGEVKAAEIIMGAVDASEIAANSVDASKIVDGSVGSAEIGRDAVGASEIAGVSTLLFSECKATRDGNYSPQAIIHLDCGVSGAGSGNVAIATIQENSCFVVMYAKPLTDSVRILVRNVCEFDWPFSDVTIAIIVFDTAIGREPPP